MDFFYFYFFKIFVHCRMWQQSGDKIFEISEKTEKSRKKSKKTRFLGVPKKGKNSTPLYPRRFWQKSRFFGLLIAPLAVSIQKPDTLPRSCFYTVPVLVVGGVQSGDNFFSLFFQDTLRRRHFRVVDFRR